MAGAALLLPALLTLASPAPHAAPSTPVGVLRPASADSVAEIEEILDAVVASLHDGRYGETERLLLQAGGRAPRDPGVSFLRAYALAWQGASDLGLLFGDRKFLALLDAVLEEPKEGSDSAGGREAYYRGLAAMLRAHARLGARERDPMRAFSDARQGVRALERAIAQGYEAADASFWLGAYHLTVSSLPPAMRALRVLLGLPGGNLETGLAELRRAAEHGRRFRPEAALLLSVALPASDRKAGYVEALAILRRTLPELTARGSLLPMYAGELLAQWGLTPQALSVWQGILERDASCSSCYPPAEIARVRIGAARALFSELRWAEAVARLEVLAAGMPACPAFLRERALLLLARCRVRLGERQPVEEILASFDGSEQTRRRIAKLLETPLPDSRVEAELAAILQGWKPGQPALAREPLREFSARHPLHAAGLLHAGRAAFAAGDIPGAVQLFQALLDLDGEWTAPADARGWAHLYLGWAADSSGHREEAVRHYRRAERMERFDGRSAGALYSQVPYGDLPSRHPDFNIVAERGLQKPLEK